MWGAKFAQCGKGKPVFSILMAGSEGRHINIYWEAILKVIGKSNHSLATIVRGLRNTLGSKISKASTEQEGLITLLGSLRKHLITLIGSNGIMIYPSFPKLPQYHYLTLLNHYNGAYSNLFNALGFPVTQCPLGLSKDGLPMGIQVVACPYNDRLCISAARALEQKFGGWVSPASSYSAH